MSRQCCEFLLLPRLSPSYLFNRYCERVRHIFVEPVMWSSDHPYHVVIEFVPQAKVGWTFGNPWHCCYVGPEGLRKLLLHYELAPGFVSIHEPFVLRHRTDVEH